MFTNNFVKIYASIAGQIGDSFYMLAVVKYIKSLYPNSYVCYAVSKKYSQVVPLIETASYIDETFVFENYFEKLTQENKQRWIHGADICVLDVKGEDEVQKESQFDIVFESRPRSIFPRWWEKDFIRHQIEDLAYSIGLPIPFDYRNEFRPHVAIPKVDISRFKLPTEYLVLHNEPNIHQGKKYSYFDKVIELVHEKLGLPVVIIGQELPQAVADDLLGIIDLRGQTTLVEVAGIIGGSLGYVGVDSGTLILAAALDVPCVACHGTLFRAAGEKICTPGLYVHHLQSTQSPDLILPDEVFDVLVNKVLTKMPYSYEIIR